MTTGEIILAAIQAVVIPFIGWMALSIIDNAKRTSTLEGKWETYMELLSIKAVKTLHSPHTPEFDELLDKWLSTVNGGQAMSEQELKRFVYKLEMAEAEKGDHFRSQAASLLRAIVLSRYPKLRENKT